MDRAGLQAWIEAYERAWRAPGTEGLAELFAGDATYSTAPFATPHRGLDQIRRMWEEERSPGEEFEMSSEVVAVEGQTGVARIDVRYRRPREQDYRDLWIVQFGGAGLCIHFEEWPFWPPGSRGAAAPGAGGASSGV